MKSNVESKPYRVSGFTIVRNAEKFDYPYIESIRSLLPLVSEMVVNVGTGEDETHQKILELSREFPNIVWNIFESIWPMDDPEKKKGGVILSEQTNSALKKCTGDLCFYLQADEVLNEQDYPKFRFAFQELLNSSQALAVVFEYRHFYGSYGVIQYTRRAYRREIRLFKNRKNVVSVGDAQSFRSASGEKLNALLSDARIFHYGWARSPEKMREKTFFMDQLYHGDPSQKQLETGMPHTGTNYRYEKIWGLRRFNETHPKVMESRIQTKDWNWDLENSKFRLRQSDYKNVVLDFFEKVTGIRLFEYRCYRLIKDLRNLN